MLNNLFLSYLFDSSKNKLFDYFMKMTFYDQVQEYDNKKMKFKNIYIQHTYN
jgi:hypothetical protein